MATTIAKLPEIRSAAFGYPMEHILSRYGKDHPQLAADAKLHEQELKKYLYICSQHPEKGWPMVNSLDELWHTFMIFTKDYHQFCQTLGLPYIHHQPLLDGEDSSDVPAAYQEFLSFYRMDFGDPPTSIWPEELKAQDCGSGCSGGGCSGIGCGSSCGSSCR